MTTEKLEKLIKIVAIVRLPFIIILLLVVFWVPIKDLVAGVPTIVEKSESISIGSLTLKMKRELKTKSTDQITEAIYGLSPQSILEIVDIYKSKGRIIFDEDTYLFSAQELEEKGMLRILDDSASRANSTLEEKAYSIKVTPLGKQAGKYLDDFLTVFVTELSKSPDTSQIAKN